MSNSFRMIEYEGEDAGQVLFHILTGGKGTQQQQEQEEPQSTSKIGFAPNDPDEEEHEQHTD